MIFRKGLFAVLLLLASTLALTAQQSTTYTEANLAYERGLEFFNQQIYGLAQKEFRSAMDLLRPVNEPEWRAIKTSAQLYHAKCAVRLNQPEAEKLTLDILRESAPSPEASQAALEIGDYYFDRKEYDKALVYYDMAPNASGPTRDEIRFKKGYSFFVTKQFARAKGELGPLKENTRSARYFDANYYYGCCAFFEKKYDEATKCFTRCEQSEKYRDVVPYYITQIYAAKKQYDQVIIYGEPKAKSSNYKNRPELNQLVGQAYYEKGDFKKALPFLEYAAANGTNFRPADYYQLGYTQYQNGYYKNAIQNFEELTKKDSVLGQNGLYHLGDCYLKTNNKFAARNAFGQAASLNFDNSVKEDALINYAKLSYELKYDRDAIDALQRIPANSRYYDDAQALMSEVFLNTRDYDRAIATLEGIRNRTPKLNETYQKVTYLRGLQLYQNNQRNEARNYFNKSLEYTIDKRTAALCSFWLGTIAHENTEYNISKSHMSAFLNQSGKYNDLPEESNTVMGQYVQGYNYIKTDDYRNALTNFKAVVDGIKRNSNLRSEQIKTAVLGDATLRAGDCHFKNKQYNEALSYYNEAATKKYKGFEYALYQKAMIKGLQRNPLDKVVLLEDLIDNYPSSQFTDEALFQLGDTYQTMGKLDQATQPLRRLVQDFRGRSTYVNQALLRLGLISYNQGNTTNAINYYKQVFSNNPENQEAKDALSALEEIYVRDLNQPDQYFAFLETVPGYKVNTASKDSVTYYSAEIQFQNGRYPQAIDGFSNYIAKYANGRYVLQAYYYRAESYVAGNDPTKAPNALKDYQYVISKGSSRFYAKAAEKGALIAQNTLKDYPQALEFARKWEESAINDNARLNAQLIALEAAYRTNNSVTVTEYATKVGGNPLASPEQQAYANFYTGKLAYDKGDFGRAYPLFSSVVKNTTSAVMPEAYHYMAQMLYRQRKYTETDELITEANQASAGYDDWIARNLILLSDVYLDMGDKNSAIAAIEVVMENYKGNDPEITNTARTKYNKLTGNNKAPTNKGLKNGLLEMDDN